ncbi:MAG: SprT-like domain-containing protein [Thermoplasmatota archaeon]
MLGSLAHVLEVRWIEAARLLPGGVPPHHVVFSRRITTSWAIIYYRRREVRLSPYVFLLPPDRLRYPTDFQELAATILHEVAHAHLWAATRDCGHPPEFATRLSALGIRPNGGCDLGPENIAYRFRYACTTCKRAYPRRARTSSGTRCGHCKVGGALELIEELPDPWHRLGSPPALTRIARAIEEGTRARLVDPVVTTAGSAVH